MKFKVNDLVHLWQSPIYKVSSIADTGYTMINILEGKVVVWPDQRCSIIDRYFHIYQDRCCKDWKKKL